MSNTKQVSVSFPFLGLLALLFIGLKLGGIGVVATWSWLWVLSPLWIPFATVLGIGAIALFLYAIFKK